MINLFFNKKLNHIENIKKKLFCTICYNITDHDTLNCPNRCKKCNGFHKTEEHRCLICNIKNPHNDDKNCKFFTNNLHVK